MYRQCGSAKIYDYKLRLLNKYKFGGTLFSSTLLIGTERF